MPKKILAVDDGELNRDLMTQLLGDDYTIVLAADGDEGLRKAEAERPDMILMDLGLPALGGWEATRRLKANRSLKHIPVIAITSHAMVGDANRAREAGCDEYLAKPIAETEPLRTIRRFV